MPFTLSPTKLVAGALVAGLAFTPTAAAAAGAPATASAGGGSYTITLYTLSSASAPGNPGSARVLVTPGGERLYPVMFPTITTNSRLFSNAPCVAVFFLYYSTSYQASAMNFAPQLLFVLNRHYPLCTYRTVRSARPPSPPVVNQQMIRSVVTRELPSPVPSMDPRYGVAGLAAYLTTGARLTDTLQTTSAAGSVHANAQGTVTIDWGDGSPAVGPTSAQGGPWPAGDLRHLYASPDCYRVTVTVNWLVHYDAAGQNGTLSGIQTSGVIPQYCVYKVASVMLR